MTDVPDYLPPASAPTQAVHQELASTFQWQSLSQDQLNSLRSRLIESIIQVVVQAVTGIFVPGGGVGSAVDQLQAWATAIPGVSTILDMIESVTGFDLTTLFSGFGTSSSILTQLIGLVPGTTGGLSGLGGLGSIFTDWFHIIGSPTAVGSGTPALPGVTSIPLLGGLFSGGNILGSLIPGLDASKIITGNFSISQITNLATLLGGFGTSSSILTQLIGLVPGTTGGLSGLSGFGSVITDLFGMLGSPTAVGSGTPVLPAVTSRPILGGLFSGGSLLGSLIPALDASKVTTGTFTDVFLPGVTLLRGFLVGGIVGNTVTDPNDAAVNEAITGQTETISATAAALAALQATQTGTENSGNFFLEDFEYTDTDSLDSDWSRTVLAGTNGTNGTIAVADGHNAGMVAGGTAALYEEFNHYVVGTTQTAYQKISVVVASVMGTPGFFDGRNPALTIGGRTNGATATKWAKFNWYRNGDVKLFYRNGGSVTQLGSTATGKGYPSVGTNVSMECGTAGGVNVYRLLRGSAVLHTVTDSSHVIDETQLGGGWGQINDNNLLPGKIAHWSMADNTPSPTVGTGFRVYRNSTSTVSFAGTTGAQFPNNFFDTTEVISADITLNLASHCSFTVTKTGFYTMSLRLHNTTNIGDGLQYLIRDDGGGSLVAIANGAQWPGGTDNVSYYVMQDTFVWYATAGQTFCPAYVGEQTFSAAGSTGGNRSYMAVTYVG